MKFNLSNPISKGLYFPAFVFLSVILIVNFVLAQENGEKVILQAEESDERLSPHVQEAEKSLSPLAKAALSRRIEELVAERMENCRLKAIKDAEVIIDSLIIQEALEQRHLEETFPEKPIKPELPDTTLKGDSLKIKPLFED